MKYLMNSSALIRLSFLLYLLLFLISCEGKSQQIKIGDFAKYFALSSPTNELVEAMEDHGFERVRIMYANRNIDTNLDGNFEKETFLNKLFEVFPDKESAGILVLDWERTGARVLKKNSPKSKKFQQTLHEMVSLLQLVHQSRPQVLVGYYGLPFRIRNGVNKNYVKRQNALTPIFKSSDIIFPSIYNIRVNTNPSTRKKEYLYVKNTVEYSLKIAKKYNKYVIPFIWHRYHGSDPNKPLGLIPVEEFKNECKKAKDAVYKGKTINGVVWWSNDYRSYLKKRRDRLAKSAKSAKSTMSTMSTMSTKDAKSVNEIPNDIQSNVQKYSRAINEIFDVQVDTTNN